MMESQVMMVNRENEDLQAILESVLIYQDPLVDLDKKEIEEHQERLVLLVKMATLELLDLRENAANMHHLASQATLVDQENLVKMVNQDSQEYLVIRDRKEKLSDWKKLKIKLKMVSNLFVHNYVTVAIEMVMDMVVVSVLLMILMMKSHVHHMERCVFIFLNLYTDLIFIDCPRPTR